MNHKSLATQQAVTSEEPLLAGKRYDYADAFEISVSESDSRSAEQFARFALEQAPLALRKTVLFAHKTLLKFRLGPFPSNDHILGWKILAKQQNLIHLEASSNFIRGVIVARRAEPTRVVLTTYVFYLQPVASSVWAVVAPIHRQVARYLLERTANKIHV